MSELKPCPFCGSVRAPEVSDVGECEECSKFDDCGRLLENHTCEGCDEWERPMFVVCNYNVSGCGVSGPYRRTEAEAIAAWNTRHVETCENMREKFGYKRLFVCSECGVSFDPDCEINYCPSCGRKVVGE